MGTRRRTHLITTILLLTFFCSASAGSEAKELKVKIERDVPVRMRDGTILRADIHSPNRGGPYPVLVRRTPYGKGGNFNRFVKAGYIVVNQDVRGLYASEGKFEGLWWDKTQAEDGKLQDEDGYDTVEWAAKLPGSNGKVGTFGRSALAGMQWRLAPLCPPSLVVMLAESKTARLSDQFPSGIRRPYTALKVFVTRRTPEMRRRANLAGVHTKWEALKLWEQDESKKWINFLPWRDLARELFQNPTDDENNSVKTDNFDYLKLDEGCKDISVPNLDITGWYDFCNNDMLLFRTMVNEAKTEAARKGTRIIIGPWSHGTPAHRRVGDFDFGSEASLDDLDGLRIRWFDYWLKGKQNGVDKDAPVRIFVMGDNRWRDEQHWPLRRAKEKILFVTSEGHANSPSGDGKITQQKPENAGKDQYLYDPKNPVPTLFDPILHLLPIDQRPLADREDILVYQSEPLAERMEVTGNPAVELYAESSAPDTDWFVTLIDVAPDGLARNVCMGVMRARYRDGLDEPKLLKPGEVVRYTIRMNPTSNAFLPGHRIRLDVTSSDFPNYDRNHNTAANQNADATLVTANQTIYHGGQQATRIILPWVPNPTEEEKPSEEEPEPEPEKRMYPLHQAAADGDIEQVRLLISKGININAPDEKKNTPLCRAVESAKMELVQLLVEAGAEVNAGSWPPLCVAVDENNIAIAEYLIAHGANINAPKGWTALQEAPYITNNIKMIELLIANGADINAGPYTALHAAVTKGRTDIVELLIQKGADINAKDKRGHAPLKAPEGLTLLHYMSAHDTQNIVEQLLAKGAKVDERDGVYEFTALHYAARFGSTKVAEVLIANGADIEAKDKWDYQPIHWAAYHDRPDIVELLIAKGADVNAKTSLGQTPLELAMPRRNTAAIEVLRKHGAKE